MHSWRPVDSNTKSAPSPAGHLEHIGDAVGGTVVLGAEGGHGAELGSDGPAFGPGVDTDDDRAPPHRGADDAEADHPQTYDDDRRPHADLGQVDAIKAHSGHDEEAPRIGGYPGGQQLGPVVARGVEHGHGGVRPRPAVERFTRAPELQGGVAAVVDRVPDGVAG